MKQFRFKVAFPDKFHGFDFGGEEIAHLACEESYGPEVIEIRTSGGSFTQNRNGRCEDAPCCGCCTF